MKTRQLVTLAAATWLGTFGVQAHANNCGELSPLMTSLGKQYTELTYSTAGSTGDVGLHEVNLTELINTSKLHSGHGVRVECFGENGRWEEVTTAFTLTDIEYRETSKGSLILTAFEETAKELSREVIELPSAEKWQSVSDNFFSSSYLFRLKNFSSEGSRAAEIALTIQSRENAVVVTETLYINGLKVDWVTWELDS